MRVQRLALALLLAAVPVDAAVLSRTALVGQEREVRILVADAVTDADLAGVHHAWIWSDVDPPRKVLAADWGRDVEPVRYPWLRVTVRGAPAEAPGVVVGAPLAMWEEVPEAELPRWALGAGGQVALPVDGAETWRVRHLGAGRASWWVDVPAGVRQVEVLSTTGPAPAVRIEDEEGRGIPGARLALAASRRGEKGSRTWALHVGDGGGLVRLSPLPDQEELTVVADGAGRVPLTLSLRIGSLPPVLRPPAGATLTGRLLDSSGKPIAEGWVVASGWAPGAAAIELRRQAKTAADGAFRLDRLPRGKVGLVAGGAGFSLLERQLELAADTDLGALTLAAGHTLAVRVVDDLDRPVAGAAVVAAGVETTTDAAGRGSLTNLGPPPWRVSARAPGHREARVTVDQEPAPGEAASLSLGRSFQVRGRLIDPVSGAVAEGSVRVEAGNHYHDEPIAGDGSFELDLEPRSFASLALRSPSTLELRAPVEAGEPGDVLELGDLEAPAGLVVRGRVVADDDGSAVAGARVWAPRGLAGGELIAWAQDDLLESVTGADGELVVRGLARAPSRLRIEAPGFARRLVAVTAEADTGLVELGEIRLLRGASLLVRLDRGEARDDAVARADLIGDWRELDMLTAPVVAGEARLADVPPGPVLVSVVAGRELLCELRVEARGGEEQTVDCERSGGRLSGLVTVGGRPAGPGTLQWMSDAPSGEAVIFNLQGTGSTRQQIFGAGRPDVEATVRPDGSFEVDAIAAGRYQVSFRGLDGGPTPLQAVDVPAVAEHRVALAFSPHGIRGRVVDAEGRAVAGARVDELTSHAFGFADPAGDFSLNGVEPGLLLVQARDGERSSEPLEVVLAADRRVDPVTLVLVERSEPVVTVFAATADGEPSPGAFVFLDTADGAMRLQSADRDGVAEFELRPPWPRQVRVAVVDGGRWGLGDWVAFDRAADGLVATADGSGGLEVTARETRGGLAIRGAGWDLASLLLRLGVRPVVEPGLPFRLDGLPAGSYQVAAGELLRDGSVEAGDWASVELP